jgi:hypothetical protein
MGGFVSLAILLLFFAEQGNGKTLIGLDPIFGLDATQKEGTRAVGPLEEPASRCAAPEAPFHRKLLELVLELLDLAVLPPVL